MAVTWTIVGIPRAVDGDTVAATMAQKPVELGYGLMQTIHTKGARSIRLITVDTPERGEDGWADARFFVRRWLETRIGRLMVETYESGGWDRLMGDIYLETDRTDTLTQALLQEGYGTYRP